MCGGCGPKKTTPPPKKQKAVEHGARYVVSSPKLLACMDKAALSALFYGNLGKLNNLICVTWLLSYRTRIWPNHVLSHCATETVPFEGVCVCVCVCRWIRNSRLIKIYAFDYNVFYLNTSNQIKSLCAFFPLLCTELPFLVIWWCVGGRDVT